MSTSPQASDGVDRIAYTMEEVAHALGTSRAFVYAEAARGNLQTVKLGRCRRVLHTALIAYAESAPSNGAA